MSSVDIKQIFRFDFITLQKFKIDNFRYQKYLYILEKKFVYEKKI